MYLVVECICWKLYLGLIDDKWNWNWNCHCQVAVKKAHCSMLGRAYILLGSNGSNVNGHGNKVLLIRILYNPPYLKELSPYKYMSVYAILNFCWQTADGLLLSHNSGNVNSSEKQTLLNPSIILRNFFGLISIAIKWQLLFDDWKEVDIGHEWAIYVDSMPLTRSHIMA